MAFTAKANKKWCGKCGDYMDYNPETHRCYNCKLKVRIYGRATKASGRIKRLNTVKRY